MFEVLPYSKRKPVKAEEAPERKNMSKLDVVKSILEENLDINPADVTEASTFESLGIDSLDLLELITELEERLDIDFGEPEGLQNMGDLVRYLETL